jgi:formylglycine-generating enzyme required for sulfatase activity
VGITLAEAEAACQARGGRLCTRREWEHACRGDAGTAWPYGGEFEPGACNASTARRGALEPAGSRQRCRSPIGAHDMSGNAAEWVSGGEIRGGSSRDLSEGRCSRSEQREGPQRAYPDVGFRCCAEPARP